MLSEHSELISKSTFLSVIAVNHHHLLEFFLIVFGFCADTFPPIPSVELLAPSLVPSISRWRWVPPDKALQRTVFANTMDRIDAIVHSEVHARADKLRCKRTLRQVLQPVAKATFAYAGAKETEAVLSNFSALYSSAVRAGFAAKLSMSFQNKCSEQVLRLWQKCGKTLCVASAWVSF